MRKLKATKQAKPEARSSGEGNRQESKFANQASNRNPEMTAAPGYPVKVPE